MTKLLKTARGFLASTSGKITIGASAIAAGVAAASVAGATGTTIVTAAFASETTTLTTYMGLAAVLVFAVLAIGVGIRLVVKWVKLAAGRGS